MSAYLPTLDEVQQDQAATAERVLRAGALLNALAALQRENYDAFWNRDPQRVIAELNSDGQRYITMFIGNTALNHEVNQQLQNINVPQFSSRGPTSMPPEYSLVEGVFVYTPPPPPQPENPLDVEP